MTNTGKGSVQGWKKLGDLRVWVEDGVVVRGLTEEHNTVFPYRWNAKTGVHDNVSGFLTMNALRSAERRETINWN